jgi:DNA-binding NarL/FixJ family response regulator
VLLVAEGYTVIGTARDGLEGFSLARTLRPELILMDIEMPGCDGLTAARLIKAEMPEIKIVMLTVSARDEHLFEAVKSGANGYLLKSQDADSFLAAVAQVQAGGAAIQPELAARLLAEFARQAPQAEPTEAQSPDQALTPRQSEILTLVAKGLTYQEVCDVLHLSHATIRYHMGQVMDRLHLGNRAQVIAYAAQHGLIGPTKR